MRRIALSAVLVFLSMWGSSTVGAVDVDVDGVLVTASTNTDTYYASTLSVYPIIVTLAIENNTHDTFSLSNDPGSLGIVSIAPVETMNTSGTITSSCSTCWVWKDLFPLPTYLNKNPIKASLAKWSRVGAPTGARAWVMQPNTRRTLARIEVYKSDFNRGAVSRGVYEVQVILPWDFSMNTANPTFPYSGKTRTAGTLIQIK